MFPVSHCGNCFALNDSVHAGDEGHCLNAEVLMLTFVSFQSLDTTSVCRQEQAP